MKIELMHGDCLEWMKKIPDGSVDMILCDMPYGTTKNKWDSIIPLEKVWEHYKRIIKINGAIVLFAQQPFASTLIQSAQKLFRYEWIYEKPNATGFLDANRKPLRAHENILVFYQKRPTYNPQKEYGQKCYRTRSHKQSRNYGSYEDVITDNTDGSRYPRSVIHVKTQERGLHPTQKPVPLLEYLIRTYTNEGELVLDNCMGGGSTGVACINTNRNFIGIELDDEYFEIAQKRIAEAQERADKE